MPGQIERDYTIDDLQMLQRAQVFHNNFVADQAAFVADFPHLATPFETEFQAAIDAADAIPSGAEVDAEIADVTFDLNEQLPLGRKALQKLYTYVELAWPKGNKNNSFGRNKYEKARNSQLKMKELLEQAHRQAEVATNKTALLAAGYTQAAIDELQTIETAIDTLNAQQEDMLAGRFEKTYNRITAYNTVWGFMQQINKASKVTFEDNLAKIEMYLLYPTSSQSLPKPQNLQMAPKTGNPEIAVLTWEPVAGAVTYKVYFSETALGQPSGSFAEIGDVEGAVMYEAPIVQGRENWWRIRAYGGGLVSAYSDIVGWTA
ncbi:MAG: hypothetical protein Kapaf2KO_15820 [Candidatus Kapaibacteriales bacterium]